jgi:transposase-like protein
MTAEKEKPELPKAAAQFIDEDKAREFLEKKRWPEGPVCPHCGELNNAYRLEPKKHSEKGKHVRKGVWKCGGCREQFTITVGTVFEDSHVPLNRWLLAIHLLCASKKGMSAHQLFRMMRTFYGERGSYKTAWFMFHRLRFAMTQHPMIDKLKGIVEIDETWVGPKEKGKAGVPGVESKKRPVVALMERGEKGGRVRSFHVERVTLNNIKPIMKEHVEAGSRIQTDEATVYHFMHDDFPDHDVVTHRNREYSRYENGRHVTTNTVEGYFGLLKRGLYGTYHHVGRNYLQQYLNEFDFRYNARKMSDFDRTVLAIKAAEGKRLTMKEPSASSV